MPERLRLHLSDGIQFKDADLRAMGEAFDKAKAKLDGRPHQIELHKVASQIIILAQAGERNPDRLCDGALAALNVKA